jgi:ubiquinone/menaquinone biosynthesis C-methylase UbiE
MMSWWESSTFGEAWYKVAGGPENMPPEQVVQIILQGIPRGTDALEIGAGVGRLMTFTNCHFNRVDGLDIAQSMVEYSRKYLQNYPLCNVYQNDGLTFPLPDNHYDFVYSYTAFQHMHTLDIIKSNIQETYRVLRQGGKCRIQTVLGKSYRSEDGNHAYLFENPNNFQDLFQDVGFKNVTLELGGTHACHIWITGAKNA